jgi:hypothetical protein
LASGIANSSGGANTGYATTARCTNWTGATIQIRHVVRHPNGTVAGVQTYNVPGLDTLTASTHGTVFFDNESLDVAPGITVNEGAWQILSTNPNVTCTMTVLDASVDLPSGFPVHLVRFNPIPGSVE